MVRIKSVISKRSLGLEWSLSEVVTPPLHDLETPHREVAQNIKHQILQLQLN